MLQSPETPPEASGLRSRVVACLAASALVFSACGETESRESEGPSESAIHVEAVQVQPERFIYEVALTGQLEAEHSVSIKPEIEGVIEEIFGVEGQPVKQGDILFRLQDREQRARLDEALAEERLKADTYARTQQLSRSDISSVAREAEALAKLDVTRAKVALARIEFDRTRVRAPFDGVLGMRHVSPGERLREEDGLIKIEAIDRLQLVFTTVEFGAALAQTGADIFVRVAAYPGQSFPGTVFFISPTIDPATRRLVMKAWIPNGDHRLKPGMFANVDVNLPARDDTILVPESAMVYDRHGVYIWRAGKDDRAEKVPVEIGQRQDGRVEITSGVEPGDWVITAGNHKATAGAKLEFARTTVPSDEATALKTPPEVPDAIGHES